MADKRDVSTTSDDDLDRAISGAKPITKTKGKRRAAPPVDTEAGEVEAGALPPTFADLRADALERMARRRSKQEKPVPVPWEGLGKQMGGGLWPGVYVLVGGTGVGRSQLTMQLALCAAKKGVPAAYVGLELDNLQLVARVNSLAAYEEAEQQVHWSHVYLGEEDAPDIMADWRKWPLHLATMPPFGWSADDLTALATGMRARYPEKAPGGRPFLLIVDFLQLVDGKDEGTARTLDLRERIGRAAYAARAAARDLNAAVVLVSSTAREHYSFDQKRDKDGKGGFGTTEVNPRTLIGMGKESGEIEYAADAVLVLGQTDDGPPDSGVRNLALGIAKNRALSKHAGPTRYVNLMFDGTTFTERKPNPKLGPTTAPKAKRNKGGTRAAL